MIRRRPNIYFNFTSPTPGTFIIALHYKGREKAILEMDLNIDDLLDVSSGIYIEKEIAADTIGTIFASTRSHFLPYVEPCTLELLGLLNHFYEGIRKSATDSLLEIIRTFYDLSEPPEWQPGYSVSAASKVWRDVSPVY